MTEHSTSGRAGPAAKTGQSLGDLLLERQRKQRSRIRSQPRINKPDGNVYFPTSWSQQRLWFIDQLGEANTAYNIPLSLHISGDLDTRALRRSMDALVARHESLRTAFVNVEGNPFQKVMPPGDFPLNFFDLADCRDSDRQSRIHAYRVAEARHQFDLSSDSLIRGCLLRIGAHEYVLLLTMHHIVCDAWSLGVLIRDFSALYSGFVTGDEPVLRPLALQYADFALWQRESIQGDRWRTQLDYWKSQLEGAPSEIELPTDRPRPARLNYRGQNVPLAVDRKLTRMIRALAHGRGMTLFMIFHAAWALFLSRITGQRDVVIGAPVLNRQSPDVEDIIGFFVNSLALRVEVNDAASMSEFLDNVKRTVVGAHKCQDLPFEQLVELIRPERSLNRHPVFQVMIAMKDSLPGRFTLPGAVVELEESFIDNAKFDLLLMIEEGEQQITGFLNYDVDLFDRGTMEHWAESLTTLLEKLAFGERLRVRDLSILTERQQNQLVYGFNATRAPYSNQSLVHDLFSEQVARTPDRIAIIHEGQCVSYSELDRRTDQLAQHLRSRGVGPERLVGVCVERSSEMLVGLIGILKAGGAYLPLDPNYPVERLEHMVRDAAPQLVLTKGVPPGSLPSLAHIVDLTSKLKEDRDCSDIARDRYPSAMPENLVYVIYTSGSTGRPKGTAMPHGSVVNLIDWHRANFGDKEGRRVLQFAALSFDVAFQEIFSSLCTGATLVMLNESIRRDADALSSLLIRQSVHRLFLPPVMLQSLAELCRTTNTIPMSLEDVIVAGEQLRISPEICRLFSRLEHCRLHNHYGPTETHVVTSLTLDGNPGQWPALPSIGQPVANTQMYVLDDELRPVPVGARGELYIGGVPVARGYLGQPGLTAERFICDPFSTNPHSRLYRTGDLGRWHVSGTLECLGRNDDQVKIRGYRIELGEVVTRLTGHERVKEATVIALEDAVGDKNLVAYVALRESAHLNIWELREHLETTLPAYMIPSAFVIVPSLPTSPNGKLNRRALPAPGPEAYPSQEKYEPPEGDTEKSLAEIWQQLLRVERVGRHDNFFEQGGHSLLAMRALHLVAQRFETPLKVADIYGSPTISQLAVRIRGLEQPDGFIDLEHESSLPPQIPFSSAGPTHNSPRAILLTGATGFIGRFLLAQLVLDTQATIICIVRGESQSDAHGRLTANLVKWDLWNDEVARRVVVVQGDLARPKLGLDGPTCDYIAEAADVIYHCGASMNHLESYAMAKPANVGSVKELLTLAAQGSPKLINYISTLGVYRELASGSMRVVSEDTPVDTEKHRHSQGYLGSKWVGDQIMINARKQGWLCNIFRIGLVWADATEGRFDEFQREYRILKSALLSGYGIAHYHPVMPVTPVDYVAQSIVHLGTRCTDGKSNFHITSSHHASDGIFERLNNVAATRLQLLPLYDWIQEVRRIQVKRNSELPVLPLIEFAFSMSREQFADCERSLLRPNIQFQCSRTESELESGKTVCSELNDNLLRLSINSIAKREPDVAAAMARRDFANQHSYG